MNLVVNKIVHLNYHLLSSFEAGMKLTGAEVKSLRAKNGSLKEAYIKIDDHGAYLTNAYIPPYQGTQLMYESYDPYQNRTLLLSHKELTTIRKAIRQKGHTVVPIRIYASKRFIKIEIAIAKGKHQYDKREDLKERSIRMDIDRVLKEK